MQKIKNILDYRFVTVNNVNNSKITRDSYYSVASVST